MKIIIGVYGTLRVGQRANSLLSGCKYLGEKRIKIPFIMYDMGAYPALTRDGSDSHTITFDLYEVKDKNILKKLDSYEGYPHLYQKTKIRVGNGGYTILIYTMEKVFGDATIVKSGNWNKYVEVLKD